MVHQKKAQLLVDPEASCHVLLVLAGKHASERLATNGIGS